MALSPRLDRAVRYACAVSADLRVCRLPVDPLALGRCAGNDSWAWPGCDIAERGICCRRTMVQVRRQ